MNDRCGNTRRTKAKHNTRVRIYGRKNPGICLDCGQFTNYLYPRPDGSGLHICYLCKKEK